MTESIGDVLGGRKYDEPSEIKVIKNYVNTRFKIMPQVTVTQQQIVIGVKSSALAGALRPMLPQLQEACGTEKRLIIRIQ